MYGPLVQQWPRIHDYGLGNWRMLVLPNGTVELDTLVTKLHSDYSTSDGPEW